MSVYNYCQRISGSLILDIAPDDSGDDGAKAEQGERVAENVRYGQGISEGGMGGKTTESDGIAHQGKRSPHCLRGKANLFVEGHGGVEANNEDEKSVNSRREQQYGSMPNVGA